MSSRYLGIIYSGRYTQACGKLIAQYKTSVNALGSSFDAREFIKTYEVPYTDILC
jgi:hypothetical protein